MQFSNGLSVCFDGGEGLEHWTKSSGGMGIRMRYVLTAIGGCVDVVLCCDIRWNQTLGQKQRTWPVKILLSIQDNTYLLCLFVDLEQNLELSPELFLHASCKPIQQFPVPTWGLGKSV
jgi:hypothetical protein